MKIRDRYAYVLKRIENGFYRVEDGRLFNKSGKELKRLCPYGYRILDIKSEGRAWPVKQHRLMYAYYHGLDSLLDGMTINHINGNKEDNRIENLEQVSFSDNARHSHSTGLQPPPKRKITQEQAEEIRELNKRGIGQRPIAKLYGVTKNTIANIVHYKTHKY